MARSPALAWLAGAALGAAAVYLLRARSAAGGPPPLSGPEAKDALLAARLRAVLCRLCSHPDAVGVQVRNGGVTLRGHVLEDELAGMLAGLRRVPGVRHMESLLETAAEDTAYAFPALPPGAEPPAARPAPGPSLEGRVAMGTAGGALLAGGLQRGGTLGCLGAAMGGLLVAHALGDPEPGAPPLTAAARPRNARATLEVAAPAAEVFAVWSHFGNFPRFMRGVREVRETEDGISHWTVDGPGGQAIRWEAEVTALRPHHRLAWRSRPGSVVRQTGLVRLEEIGPRRTRLYVRLSEMPPSGLEGPGGFFDEGPARRLPEDLERFRSLVEQPAPSPGEGGAARVPGA